MTFFTLVRILLFSFFYINIFAAQAGTSTLEINITLYRSDYPDSILVTKKVADRLIKDAGSLWSVNKPTLVYLPVVEKKITLFRADYPDSILVTKELAKRLIKESDGIWKEIENNIE